MLSGKEGLGVWWSSMWIRRTWSWSFRWKGHTPSFRLASPPLPFSLWRLLCGWYHVLHVILLHFHCTSWDWQFHAVETHSSPSHGGGLTQEVCFLLAIHVHCESERGLLSTWSWRMSASGTRGCLLQKQWKKRPEYPPTRALLRFSSQRTPCSVFFRQSNRTFQSGQGNDPKLLRRMGTFGCSSPCYICIYFCEGNWWQLYY